MSAVENKQNQREQYGAERSEEIKRAANKYVYRERERERERDRKREKESERERERKRINE